MKAGEKGSGEAVWADFPEDLVLPILPADHPWNYRNKTAAFMEPPLSPVIGYYRQGSHQVVPIDGCLIRKKTRSPLCQELHGENIMSRISKNHKTSRP